MTSKSWGPVRGKDCYDRVLRNRKIKGSGKLVSLEDTCVG